MAVKVLFVPAASWSGSAELLSRPHLRAAKVLAKKILIGIETGNADRNNPLARMWSQYLPALSIYGLYLCAEWRSRISTYHRDDIEEWFDERREELIKHGKMVKVPGWMGDPKLHANHRQLMLWEDPDTYRAKFPEEIEPMNAPKVYWPDA